MKILAMLAIAAVTGTGPVSATDAPVKVMTLGTFHFSFPNLDLVTIEKGDQIVVGVHLDMGEIARNVRWQPNFEIGFGDDWKSLSGNVLVAYYFGKQGRFQPYAGGQLAIVYFDHDDNGFDDDRSDGDTEFGFDAVGGFEFPLGAGARMLFELQLGFGDVHDAKIVAGWKF